MSCHSRTRRASALLGFLLGLTTLFTLAPNAQAVYQLVVTVSDTTGNSGEQNSVVTVYMDNYVDTIAGFTVWLQTNRPDIIKFQTELDTVVDTTYWRCTQYSGPNCVDSVSVPKDTSVGWHFMHVDTVEAQIGNIDTVGTLIRGWEYVTTRSLSGVGTDLLVTGLANQLGGPTTPPRPPQSGGTLFKLRADVLSVPDTLQDRTVRIFIQHDFMDKFSFSKPNGNSIGITHIYVPDTVCWRCFQYLGGNCVDWRKVTFPPCDSLSYETDTVAILDTSKVLLVDGSLTVLPGCCNGSSTGNVDGDPGDIVDISDLSTMIDFLFFGGQVNDCLDEANVDGSPAGEVDISDLQKLIDFLFFGAELPPCP
ncbi:MAG: hypothetical protein AB1644_07365 [Candidatus Zixiibacteriota bacterium]